MVPYVSTKGKGGGKGGGGKGGGKGGYKGGGKGGAGATQSFTNLPWFCKQCKRQNRRGSNFCEMCGNAKPRSDKATEELLERAEKITA